MENNKRGFIPYPTNRVAGTITDAGQASLVVDALVRAGFDRQAIDVLHGEQDLRRLDPSGGAHGLLAKLQRSLIRGAAGSELKRLTHHVEDVQAGRFVVMVLTQDREGRNRAAGVLHAHGAKFVGFYGRWAYESLTEAAPRTRQSAATYDISVGADTIRVHLAEDGSAAIAPASQPATVSRLGAHLWMISWRRKSTAIVHVIDDAVRVAYTSLVEPDGATTHVRGPVTLLPA